MNAKLKSFLINFTLEAMPIFVFIFAYFYTRDFFFSVLLLVISCIISIILIWLIKKRLSYLDIYVLAVTMVFDGYGYWTSNVDLVMFRDTFYDGVLGSLCLISLYFGKPILKPMLAQYCDLTEKGWWLATFQTGIFFIGLSTVNEIVRRYFSVDAWVMYRSLTYVFVIIFIFLRLRQMRRHSPNHAKTFGFILR